MRLKKLVSTVLVCAMTLSLLAGCGSSSTSSSGSTQGTDVSAEAGGESEDIIVSEDAPTIGVVFYSKTDSLGASVYSLVNTAAKELGVNVKWEIGALDNDTQISQVQNLISAGVDGIMIIPLANTVSQKVSSLCEDAGVYLSFCFRNITDDSIKETVTANPYFVGMVSEDEQGAGEHLVQSLTSQGRTNLGVAYSTPGSAVGDNRNIGIDNGIKNEKAKKLAEFSIPADGNVNTVSSGVQNFLTAYPNMDGIVFGSVSLGCGEAVVQILQSSNQDVVFSCIDTFEGMADAFANGQLATVAGGMSPDALYSFAMLYNACMETPISDSYIEASQPYLFITNEKECETFETYISNPEKITEVFTSEYIKSLSKANSADLYADSFQKMMDSYSVDWIDEQVGK